LILTLLLYCYVACSYLSSTGSQLNLNMNGAAFRAACQRLPHASVFQHLAQNFNVLLRAFHDQKLRFISKIYYTKSVNHFCFFQEKSNVHKLASLRQRSLLKNVSDRNASQVLNRQRLSELPGSISSMVRRCEVDEGPITFTPC